MKKLFFIFMILGLGTALLACSKNNEKPTISGADNKTIFVGSEFDPKSGVTANDKEDGNLTDKIVIDGSVNVDVEGDYTLTYSVTDSGDQKTTINREIKVTSVPLAQGWHDYKYADTNVRHDMMAAAERYMLDTMGAGVPLFSNSGNYIFSERMQTPIENALPIIGFDTIRSSMSADDSTVIMDNGSPGKEGNYTYRTWLSSDVSTFNKWEYRDNNENAIMSFMYGSLYSNRANAAKNGYALDPSMAKSFPTPINATQKGDYEVSTTWRVELNEGMEWNYHSSTNTDGFDNAITADDYIYTYKTALENKMYRAIAGGGDFLSKDIAIKNAQKFVDGEVSWEEVGFKKIDDYTLEYTYEKEMSEWNVRYALGSFVTSPIHQQLFEKVGLENYGKTPKDVAYSGPFVINYFEDDKVVRYTKNDKYVGADEINFTGVSIAILSSTETAFQEFKANKLDGASIPNAEYENYKDDPRLKKVPGATTFRMMINGLGTEENQKQQFENSTYIPKAILGNINFKKAMYHAVDRQKLVIDMATGATPNMFLFSESYVVDAVEGTVYRETDQGISVGNGLGSSTHAYSPDAAKVYFEKAIDELIADGSYSAGTVSNPTIIELDYKVFAASESQAIMGNSIKDMFETIFIDDERNIQVKITVTPTKFPDIYYNYMMTGDFDLATGGISGSALNAASFLDTFSSDNRSTFTLNWGIDTSVPEIEYNGELWSYDALISALNGKVFVKDGREATLPSVDNLSATHNSVTFVIDQFSSNEFTNITYTLHKLVNGEYVEVDGYVNVTPDSANIMIENLDPNTKYQIVLNYAYSSNTDETDTYETVFSTLPLINVVENSLVVTVNSVEFGIEIIQEYASNSFTSVRVLDSSGNEVAEANIDYTDLTKIIVTGLTAETDYQIEFTFDDDSNSVHTVAVKTASLE